LLKQEVTNSVPSVRIIGGASWVSRRDRGC